MHPSTKCPAGRARNFHCPMCQSRFFSQKDLKGHIRIHVKEKPLHCKQCKYSTFKSGALARHARTVHERSVKFYCPHPGCSYVTAYKDNVKRHGHTHGPYRVIDRPGPYPHPACNYQARSVASLKEHVYVRHHPNRTRKFSCPKCLKRFYKNHVLHKHISVVHANEIISDADLNVVAPVRRQLLRNYFQCEFCDYRAGNREDLNNHTLTIHSDVRKFKCGQPGLQLYDKLCQARVFKSHVLIHDKYPEEKYPVVCRFVGCDYRTRSTGQLRSHEEVHENSEIQLNCELCPARRYPDENSLHFHEWMCHSGKSYECSYCDYAVHELRYLAVHVNTSHKDRLVPQRSSKSITQACNVEKSPVVLLSRISLETM